MSEEPSTSTSRPASRIDWDKIHRRLERAQAAHEHYAVESSFVREVYPLKELTPVLGVPAFVLGVINVRGQSVSVIDPKQFFGLPEKGLTDLNKVILITDGTMEFGLLADAVLGLRHVPLKELQKSLPTLT